MKIKDGKFEMPHMEQVTFDMEDVICTSGGDALDIARRCAAKIAHKSAAIIARM